MHGDIGLPLTAGAVNLAASTPQGPASLQQAAEEAAASTAQQAASDAARQAASQAGVYARQGASEIRVYIETNPTSVQALSFIGGLALIIASVLSLFNVFAIISGPLAYVENFYRLLFGVTICIIDGPKGRTERLQEKVLQYASFLANNTSRSMFYLFIACLEGTQPGWVSPVVGWYFVFIAAAHILVKCHASSRGARDWNPATTADPEQTGG